jgi:hypothetical protein
MNEQQMYYKLSIKLDRCSLPKEIKVSILNDFINNINNGIYPKYAYDRANGKIDYLLENWLAEVF